MDPSFQNLKAKFGMAENKQPKANINTIKLEKIPQHHRLSSPANPVKAEEGNTPFL